MHKDAGQHADGAQVMTHRKGGVTGANLSQKNAAPDRWRGRARGRDAKLPGRRSQSALWASPSKREPGRATLVRLLEPITVT
jgi:hypothetical protein